MKLIKTWLVRSFLVLSGLILSGVFPNHVYGESRQMLGTHLINNSDRGFFQTVRERSNNLGADWVPVTLMVGVDRAADPDHVASLIHDLHSLHFLPIIRLVTRTQSGHWAIMTQEEAVAAATGLSAGIAEANVSFPDGWIPIISVLNEPNVYDEWGGTHIDKDEASFRKVTADYIRLLKEFTTRQGNFRAANAPLCTHCGSADRFWQYAADAPDGLAVLNSLQVLAFVAYDNPNCGPDCAEDPFGRRSWRWEIGVMNSFGINTNKPRILTEYGPNPSLPPSNYYSFYVDLIQHGSKYFQADGFIAVTPLPLDMCTGATFGWSASAPNLSDIRFYTFNNEELTDGCELVSESERGSMGPIELPPKRNTEWARPPVYGEGIPCRKSLGDLYNDRSPWRPFPGDADARRGAANCYDLTKLDNDNQITVYCNPAPEITDNLDWFPLPDEPNGLTHYFELLGEIKTQWIDSVRATQIPFLGNSETASRQFADYTERMSFFLSDFLRGTVYFDGEEVKDNRNADFEDQEKEYRRIQNESGPIRKLFPDPILRDNAYRRQFIRCRMGNSSDRVCEPGWQDQILKNNYSRLISNDPVHDYHLYKDITLSDLPSGISLPLTGDQKTAWLHYFPLASKEDAPAFVDLGVTSIWPDPANIDIPGENYTSRLREITVPSSLPIDYLYDAVNNHDGYYWLELWLGNPPERVASEISGEPLYELHYVQMIYIPHIPESKELSEWAAMPLTPFVYQNRDSEEYWGNDGSMTTLALDNPFSQFLNCNVNSVVRGGPGNALANDVIAGDAPGYTDRGIEFYNEWYDEVEAGAGDWGCDSEPSCVFPERHTSVFSRNTWETPEWPHAWITTKIPYLREIAKRTIGPAGLFRLMLPQFYTENIIGLIKEVAGGRLLWYELPGYGPASYEYDNNLEREENPQTHWGCCEAFEDRECGLEPDINELNFCPLGNFSWDNNPMCMASDVYDSFNCGGTAGFFIVRRECAGTECVCEENRCIDYCAGTDSCGTPCGGNPAPNCEANCNCDECLNDPDCEDSERICHSDGCGENAPGGEPPTKDSLGRDFRGWESINDTQARFYYPYIGAVDVFRKYFMNEMVPKEMVKF
ncbi:MAG: hypothetical protein JW991_03600 [Candidatus Pacebacteria bacterium]|nr:hypothetical protein [Candidatus Paceibacterota bacterium]